MCEIVSVTVKERFGRVTEDVERRKTQRSDIEVLILSESEGSCRVKTITKQKRILSVDRQT